MKRFLKKHGKKVSVGLLATALMVSPMMPIVSASDSDTCEIRYHYFFLEAENAYITSNYKLKSGVSADPADHNLKVQSYSAGGTDWVDETELPAEINNVAYTGQYTFHFGLSNDILTDTNSEAVSGANKGKVYNFSDVSDPSSPKLVSWLKNGNVVMDSKANSYFGLRSNYIDDGNFLTSTIGAANNFYMRSNGQFYNLDVPEGFTKKKIETKSSWTDEEYELYFNMYKDSLKSAKANKGNPDANVTYTGSDEDFYFIHYAWNNENTSNGYAKDYSSSIFKSSDDTHALSGEIGGSKSVSELVKETKAASVDVKTTSANDLASLSFGDTAGAAELTLGVQRDYNGIENKLSTLEGHWDIGVATGVKAATTNPKAAAYDSIYDITDTYHWYYMPAMTTVTFVGSGDVCKGTTPVENTGVNNEKTGVASYAIIGTLLVGAGSAYIYARKNNKFSKL